MASKANDVYKLIMAQPTKEQQDMLALLAQAFAQGLRASSVCKAPQQ